MADSCTTDSAYQCLHDVLFRMELDVAPACVACACSALQRGGSVVDWRAKVAITINAGSSVCAGLSLICKIGNVLVDIKFVVALAAVAIVFHQLFSSLPLLLLFLLLLLLVLLPLLLLMNLVPLPLFAAAVIGVVVAMWR